MQEALLFSQPGGRVVGVHTPSPGSSGTPFSFALQSVGGSSFLSDLVRNSSSDIGLCWQVENGSAGTLKLLEFSLTAGPKQQIHLEFSQQIYPGLAFVPNENGVTVAGILSSGQLYHTNIQLGGVNAFQSLNSNSLKFVDLAVNWQTLGYPTSISGSDGHIIIGGSSGVVLCVPIACLHDGTSTVKPFELRESSWGIKSLIAGVWQRSRNPAVVAAAPLNLQHDRQLLIAVYDDCTMRGFSMGKHQQLFTEYMEQDHLAKHAMPVFASVSTIESTSQPQLVVVVQYETKDTLQKVACAYTMAVAANGKISLQHRAELQADSSATVVTARAVGDVVWLLLKGHGTNQICGFSRTSGKLCSTGVLQEALLPCKSADSGNAMLNVSTPAFLQQHTC